MAGEYATSRFTQLVALARKFRLAYWRSPSYNLTRMLMTLLICLFYGTVFWGRGRVPAGGAPPVLLSLNLCPVAVPSCILPHITRMLMTLPAGDAPPISYLHVSHNLCPATVPFLRFDLHLRRQHELTLKSLGGALWVGRAHFCLLSGILGLNVRYTRRWPLIEIPAGD